MTMKHIALFGPPGTGKFTLIDLFQAAGVPAVDLEQAAATYDDRKALLATVLETHPDKQIVFGAADLRIDDLPDSVTRVLLLPPLSEYTTRVAKRNYDHPMKSNQDALDIYYRFKDKMAEFDVVYADISSAESLQKELMRFV